MARESEERSTEFLPFGIQEQLKECQTNLSVVVASVQEPYLSLEEARGLAVMLGDIEANVADAQQSVASRVRKRDEREELTVGT